VPEINAHFIAFLTGLFGFKAKNSFINTKGTSIASVKTGMVNSIIQMGVSN